MILNNFYELFLLKYITNFNFALNLKSINNLLMKKLFLLVINLLPLIIFAQQLEIFKIDTSNYPIVSAEFLALDEKMNLIKDLTIDDCTISENEILQRVIRVENPKDTNIAQSVVMVVDVSGSMSGTNIELAKESITEFINLTPFSTTEVAIISFDNNVYVNQDFTRNKAKLLSAVSKLRASGGTNYNVALSDQKNSALKLTRNRDSKPVIIFLTDGLSSANTEYISKMANEQDAKIYTITLNMPMPEDLAEITVQTNAKYYENISTTAEAKKAYLSILFEIYDLFSKIYWEAERSCDELINIKMTAREKYIASSYYEIDLYMTKGIYFNKRVVAFDPMLDKAEDEINILSNSFTTITNITIKDTSLFDIKYNFELPRTISEGCSLKIDIFRKKDSNVPYYTEVIVETNECEPKKFYIFQGNIADFIIPGNLKVLTPNGGEIFYAGDKRSIEWKNKTSTKFVNVYYSSDNGENFVWLKRTTESEHSWLVPGVPSDECMIKISLQIDPMLIYSTDLRAQQITMSNSGNTYFVAKGKQLFTHSASTGGLLNVNTVNQSIKDFKVSPLADKIIIRTSKKMWLHNTKTRETYKIKTKKDRVLVYFFSPSAKRIIVFYKNKKSFYEYDANTGKQKQKHKIKSPIKTGTYGSGIASITTKDKRWIIYDLNQKKIIFEKNAKNGFKTTDINFNGEYAAALDNKNNILYWSKEFNEIILTVEHNAKTNPTVIEFNPNNNSLLCREKNGNITLYGGVNTYFDYTPPKGISISTVGFKPSGEELIYGVTDRNSKTFYTRRFSLNSLTLTNKKNNVSFSDDLDEFSFNKSGNLGAFRTADGYDIYLLSSASRSPFDLSDTTFEIRVVPPQIRDTVFMPDIFAGSTSAFVDTAFFYNPNPQSSIVDYLYFEGENKSRFGLVSGVPPLGIQPGVKKSVEFSFARTTEVGIYKTPIVAISGLDTLHSCVVINVIKPPVNKITKNFNLGVIKMNQKITKSIACFENISANEFIIDSVENWGPDRSQITLKNNLKNKTIAPGEKIRFDFEFHGKNRGHTNAVFKIYLKDMPEPLILYTSGEVKAPYKITVKCKVTNNIGRKSQATKIISYNSENNRFIRTYKTDSKGNLTLKLPNELSYKIVAQGLTRDSAIVDLTNIFTDTVIIVNLQVLMRDNKEKINFRTINMTEKINRSVELFENMSSEPFVIERVVNQNSDNSQFVLKNKLRNKTLMPGEKIKLDFEFRGQKKGNTKSVFQIYLKGMNTPLEVETSGKVYAPSKINVRVITTNVLDNKLLSTKVSCYYLNNNKIINSFNTDNNGEKSIQMPVGQSYKFVALSHSKDSAIVDLSEIYRDTTILVELKVIYVTNSMKYNLQNANFAVGSHALNYKTKQELDNLAFLMNQSPEINIHIDGHTDNEGEMEFNNELSEQRANSVKKYLTGKGIASERITTKGHGFEKPISSNETEKGKAINRRIEITILINKL